MQIFQEQQEHFDGANSDFVQVLNVSRNLVRLDDSGIYLGPNEFAVTEQNGLLERALKRGDVIQLPISVKVVSEVSSDTTFSETSNVVKRGRKPKQNQDEEASGELTQSEEDSEVATEEETF